MEKGYSGILIKKVRETEYPSRSDSTVLNVDKFNTNESCKSLKTLRQKNETRSIINQVNINSAKSKFDFLSSKVSMFY